MHDPISALPQPALSRRDRGREARETLVADQTAVLVKTQATVERRTTFSLDSVFGAPVLATTVRRGGCGPAILLPLPRARSTSGAHRAWEDAMAKKQHTVYKIVEVVGVSEKSWEEAGRAAVETAAGTLRDLRVAEVTQMDMKVEDGKVAAFRTRVSLSFKYEA
jgi:flavin-binding protein dodecin